MAFTSRLRCSDSASACCAGQRVTGTHTEARQGCCLSFSRPTTQQSLTRTQTPALFTSRSNAPCSHRTCSATLSMPPSSVTSSCRYVTEPPLARTRSAASSPWQGHMSHDQVCGPALVSNVLCLSHLLLPAACHDDVIPFGGQHVGQGQAQTCKKQRRFLGPVGSSNIHAMASTQAGSPLFAPVTSATFR